MYNIIERDFNLTSKRKENMYIDIYTDGACRGNQYKDNIGGYGIILKYGDYIKEFKQAFRNVTNNQMELLAVIEALKLLTRFDLPLKIYSDSQYVVNTMNMGWNRNANQELWSQLDDLLSKFNQVEFIKVKGHSNDLYNNKCDKLANQAMDELLDE